MIGIYKITNDITGQVYIGQSVDIFRRWKQHQEHCLHYELSEEDWHIDLYNNPQNYSFKVIEVCQKEELDTKEIYWIDYYNSFNDGLNKTRGGRHCEHFNKAINKPYIMEDGTVICPDEYIKQDYKNLSELIRQLKKNSKGVIYMTRISEIEKYLPQVEERGFNCGAIWSIHNEEHPMTEEQKELRDYIIKNQLIPDDIDVLFYNASYETAINIDTPVDWAIIHSSNSDKIKRALSRIRNDRPIVYTYNPNKEDEQYTVPVEWLDKPLTKEMKKELCSIMAIKDSRGATTGWTTLKRTLIKNGYKIQDKRKTINGKKISISIISE